MVVSQDKDKIKSLINQAYQVMINDPEKCLELSNQAMEIAKKIDSLHDMGVAFMHLGLGHFHRSDYE